MANANVRKTMSYEFDGSVLVLSLGDDELARFDFADLPEELDEKFLELGRKTKLANFAASAKSEGLERIDMIRDGWAQLMAGTWEKEREGGGPTVSAEVEALAKIKGATVAAIQKALREYSKEQRAKILGSERVVAEAAKIKAARETAAVNLDDLA
jgi:hypothetical protein